MKFFNLRPYLYGVVIAAFLVAGYTLGVVIATKNYLLLLAVANEIFTGGVILFWLYASENHGR